MGNNVITVGPRHVKVWRVDPNQPSSPLKGRLDIDGSSGNLPASPGPRAFSGRNCLLGALLDATFTSVVSIADDKAILCTGQGDVCLLDDSDKAPKIEKLASVGFKINTLHFDESRSLVWIGGSDQQLQALFVKDFLDLEKDGSRACKLHPTIQSSPSPNSRNCHILALGIVGQSLVIVNSKKVISMQDITWADIKYDLRERHKNLPAHHTPVLGVCELPSWSTEQYPRFATYSADGTVLFWLSDGTFKSQGQIQLDDPVHYDHVEENELRTLAAWRECLVSGDRRGIMR